MADPDPEPRPRKALKWAIVLLAVAVILVLPAPEGVTPQSWRLLAIFVGTIVGLMIQPLPVGAMVLLGVVATALSGALTPGQALAGYAEPLVWMVLAAFQLARGMIKTGLGRRIALHFIRAIGHTSLGLGYSLVASDVVLGMIIPATSARAGGIIFPIAKSVAETYESSPGPTAGRLGTFLMLMVYHCDVIVCAMFLTGQASNVLIAGFARQTAGIELSYATWALGAVVPGLVSLLVVPLLLYRIRRPEITRTPAAAEFAGAELARMGPMSRAEKLMLLVFGLVTVLWTTKALHGIDYPVVALVALGGLLLSGVLTWEDVLAERAGWDVFVWYGGIYQMARALGDTGITTWLAEVAGAFTVGWPWGAALAVLLLIYFYVHYGFASITAHASAFYIPFLVVLLAAKTPPYLAVLSLAYLSNLSASLTHYGTTSSPIYFGAGYVSQGAWWRVGLTVSGVNIAIWVTVGFAWWRVLGWW